MKNIRDLFDIVHPYYLKDDRTGTRKRVWVYNIKTDAPILSSLNDLSFNEIPIYKTTAYNNTSNFNINNDPLNSNFCSGKVPAKYLADSLFQHKSLNTFEVGSNKFLAGNLLLKDLNSGELLVLGVINKKFLNIQGNKFTDAGVKPNGHLNVFSEENYKKLEEELKERKNPIKIYISNSLFAKPEYKNLQKEILYFIQKINENKYIPVIITNNILSQVKVGYSFPKFATIDEMEEFLTKILSKTIENIKT